ncbi:hypothetical protein N7457_001379 [Penicillium paradoxum]|uniref:uncharacterized protein n=1 Tax=Penicillium paradoxum TaxID=176176 RepID=UPI0025477AA8|nr:uncharacterized protein N7457_001379 [Penicillium paradoxum]KAJ5794780.1 hypothetical protein N7457_001379 [Penicillium paradoxum]
MSTLDATKLDREWTDWQIVRLDPSAETRFVTKSEFLITTDQEMYDFLQEIVMEMQKFECPRAEAVARINDLWGGMVFKEPDLLTHEMPEHWAHFLYYEDAKYWDENEDRSTWTVKEAPPKESASWTLKE